MRCPPKMVTKIKSFDSRVKGNINSLERLNKSKNIFNNPTSCDNKEEVEIYVANNKLIRKGR